MARCFKCGGETSTLVSSTNCQFSRCPNRVTSGEGGDDNFICSYHQQGLAKKVEDLNKKVIELESKGLLNTPSQETQELRTENQKLTTTLFLKETEQAELQAEIRALNSQLTERENNQPLQGKISKLLEMIKRKLGE